MLTDAQKLHSMLKPGMDIYIVRANRSEWPHSELVKVLDVVPHIWENAVVLKTERGSETIPVSCLCNAPGKGICLTEEDAVQAVRHWLAHWSQDPGWVLACEIEDHMAPIAHNSAQMTPELERLASGVF